ncbi:TPA: hypothetical protein MG587_27540 [Klebsiella pneumoniae]|nr:hypothetical protein [Klebsiella pneumoniae]HAH4700444.1 hypothetical protein [Escherichia coli]NBZ43206.1 hypothetical protein [Klebsiella pneumoniae]NBZ53847.1 hypothetical protein [Klebsiella pneumoniae]HAH5448307.1 hypothetical protein [Escherichia coli]
MGPGEAEPAATASRRLPYPGMAAPANSSLCGCRAKVKARHSQHTARRHPYRTTPPVPAG